VAQRIERIKACLNGKRDPAEHRAVPVTPSELAAAAQACVAVGAEAVHMHPRGTQGQQSLQAADVGAAVAAVRAACPGTPIGVTTGLWVTGNSQSRQNEVAGWAGLDDEQRPDFASVNVCEPGWQQLVDTLSASGIQSEAGVWTVDDVALLGGYEPEDGWLRIMVEVMNVSAAEATRFADEILDELSQADVSAPILLHGEADGCWPLIAHAGRLGLPTRIGLEDVLAGPNGQPVADNAELVQLAVQMLGATT